MYNDEMKDSSVGGRYIRDQLNRNQRACNTISSPQDLNCTFPPPSAAFSSSSNASICNYGRKMSPYKLQLPIRFTICFRSRHRSHAHHHLLQLPVSCSIKAPTSNQSRHTVIVTLSFTFFRLGFFAKK